MEDLRDQFNQLGMRFTAQRRMIYELFESSPRGLTVAEAAAALKDRNVGEVTIYRTIRALQDGEKYMGKKNYREAAAAFDTALAKAPDDYAGLLMMAKCQAAMERWSEAGRYAAAAKQAYPGEPQALYVEGYVALAAKRYDQAYDDFAAFDKALPGNLIMTFLRGYCREQQDRTGEAAALYRRYLEAGGQGKPAQYAYARLVQWGYVRR